MREVVSSAAKAEFAGLFHSGKEATALRITLEELGHPQPQSVLPITPSSRSARKPSTCVFTGSVTASAKASSRLSSLSFPSLVSSCPVVSVVSFLLNVIRSFTAPARCGSFGCRVESIYDSPFFWHWVRPLHQRPRSCRNGLWL
jgi:hypothetical protein